MAVSYYDLAVISGGEYTFRAAWMQVIAVRKVMFQLNVMM
jgi:hypothetical protein